MFRYLLILFLLSVKLQVECSSSPKTVKLCLYLKAIRRSMPECDQIKLDNSTTMEKADETNEIFTNATTLSPLAKIIAHIEKKNEKLKFASKKLKLASFKLCPTSLNDGYKQCRVDNLCQSGYSCENKNKTRCCMEVNHSAPSSVKEEIGNNPEEFKTCPSQKQMAYFCQPAKTKKMWKSCKSDNECMFSVVQKCCDTGCGINVCVLATGNFTQNTLIFLGS